MRWIILTIILAMPGCAATRGEVRGYAEAEQTSPQRAGVSVAVSW